MRDESICIEGMSVDFGSQEKWIRYAVEEQKLMVSLQHSRLSFGIVKATQSLACVPDGAHTARAPSWNGFRNAYRLGNAVPSDGPYADGWTYTYGTKIALPRTFPFVKSSIAFWKSSSLYLEVCSVTLP